MMMNGSDVRGRASRADEFERLHVAEDDGHLFVDLSDGRRLLLGTGSPVTIAERPVVVAGEAFETQTHVGPVTLDAIRREVNARLDGILGWSTLHRLCWTLDVQNGAFIVLDRPDAVGASVLCDDSLGVPRIEIAVDGRSARAFLETGAWLSYQPAAKTEGLMPVDEQEDFVLLPAPARFTTRLFRRTIRLGGHDVTSLFGVLPAAAAAPPLVRRHWIVGAQTVSKLVVSFDPHMRTMTFGVAGGPLTLPEIER